MVTTVTYADRDVTVNGLKLHYQEWGSPAAPAILMLHGFGVSGHMFDEFAQRMEDGYRLIALDQRGHGDSDWAAAGDYSRHAFVDDVEAFRKALSLDTFILVGHSMGGLNAVSYAVEHPRQVTALVLVDVGPEAAKEGVDNIVRFTRGPDELDFEEFVEMAHRFNQRRSIENIRDRMRHRLKQMPNGKWTWKFDARFRTQDKELRVGSELTNDQTWQLYRNIAAPALLVRGAESDVLTQDVADRCVREMQRARLVVVPSAGHSVPGDNPDDFTAAVSAFIEDVGRGKFEPAITADPPPLAELVTAQDRAASRPSLLTVALVGAGALIAIAGVVLIAKKGSSTRRSRTGNGTSADPSTRSLADTVADLGRVAQRGTERARSLAEEADLTRARVAATDLLSALGGPAVAMVTSRRRSKKRRVLAGVAKASIFGPRLAFQLARSRQQPTKKSRRLLPWPA